MAKSVNTGGVVAVEHTDKDFQDYDYFLLLASKPCYQVMNCVVIPLVLCLTVVFADPEPMYR